jgi:hypothetical protein
MVLVNTTNEVSKQRNINRGLKGGRIISENVRKLKWDAAQIAKNKLSEIFNNSYFEYDIVNEKGEYDLNNIYMYVRDLWVHPSYEGKVSISHFIEMADKEPDLNRIKWIYWKRHKTGQLRVSKLFSRDIGKRRIICSESLSHQS